MQVVILAAGKSSRFYPFTNLKHKSFIKIFGKTLLEHTLLSVKASGITDVVIVVGTDPYISDLLGDGKALGLTITYVVQPEPLGMGDALLRVKEHIKDYFYLLNAHHVDFAEFKKTLEEKKGKDGNMVLLAKKDGMLHKYGFLKVEGEKVLEIVEKPDEKTTPSPYRIIGIYLLHKKFFTTLDTVSLEEYSFENALSSYAQTDSITMAITDKETVSLKYPWDLFGITDYLLKRMPARKGKNVVIAHNAVLEGDIIMGDKVKILEGACIKGPCYLGNNVIVGNNAIVRNGSVLGDGVVAGANIELKHTILLDNATTHSGFIGDSIIGENTMIAGNITTGNVRLDRKAILTKINKKQITTGERKIGIITGNDVKIGISVSTMPGIVIGNNSLIGPGTTVMENVAEDTTFYTTFQTVTKKHTKKLI